MKVLMLCLTNDLRFDQRIHRAAQAVGRAGHEVISVGMKTWETLEREDADGYSILRLPTGPFPFFPNEGLLRHLPRLLKEKPDVVHVHDAYPLLLGAILARFSGARFVYDSHEYWPAIYDLHPSYRWIGKFERIAARQAKLWIVPSDQVGRDLREYYKIPAPILTIRNIPADIDAAKALPFPITWPKERTLVFWGGIKNGRMMAEVHRLLHDESELHLVLAGPGDLLPLFLNDAAIRERVHYLGQRSQAELLAVGESVTIGLSLYVPAVGDTPYNLPNKLFEFIRCGIPVIASDLPEMRKVLDETGSGMPIVPGDYESLRTGVKRILAELPRFRSKASASANMFPWKAEAAKLADAYTALESA